MALPNIILTTEQESAVTMVQNNPVSILTGGPGTGKTTSCKSIIGQALAQKKKVSLCAPSGKAAKRMYEATGHRAQTIHSLLETIMGENGFRFERGEDKPLESDLVICDETSMVSNDLMASLLRAIDHGTKILFVGDQDQLPSVGAGAVLRDMLASQKIPHVELTEIQRNAGDIVKACYQIKQGRTYSPSETLDPDTGLNLRHIEVDSEYKILQAIRELVTKRLPLRGYDPIWDIQVISPVNKRTQISCDAINEVLQRDLNKNPKIEKTPFRIGDKAIRTKNKSYDDMYVVNGDMCEIMKIGSKITAKFFDPERVIDLPKGDNHLLLAYAITCHRFQGSEAPVVIIPVHKTFGFFVTRAWIYTAISRAQQICITVGQKSAIRQAIRNEVSDSRITRLKEKLI